MNVTMRSPTFLEIWTKDLSREIPCHEITETPSILFVTYVDEELFVFAYLLLFGKIYHFQILSASFVTQLLVVVALILHKIELSVCRNR